jgi:hypothetical protein
LAVVLMQSDQVQHHLLIKVFYLLMKRLNVREVF